MLMLSSLIMKNYEKIMNNERTTAVWCNCEKSTKLHVYLSQEILSLTENMQLRSSQQRKARKRYKS